MSTCILADQSKNLSTRDDIFLDDEAKINYLSLHKNARFSQRLSRPIPALFLLSLTGQKPCICQNMVDVSLEFIYAILCDAIDECAAKTANALQFLSTNHDPPPAYQSTHSFDSIRLLFDISQTNMSM
jgi:hypothetical protein